MKKLKIRVLTTCWGYLWRVVEQSHRGRDFGNGGRTFKASNGLKLTSMEMPETRLKAKTGPEVFVRGAKSKRDKRTGFVSSKLYPNFKRDLALAVKEYNARFGAGSNGTGSPCGSELLG